MHGINESGKLALLHPTLKTGILLELIAKLPPCLIGNAA